MADTTLFGCPASLYAPLAATCSLTAVPSCATGAAGFDQACCGSFASFGTSVVSCVVANAPSCFDFSAAESAFATVTAAAGSACAAFLTAGPSASVTPISGATTASGSSATGSSGGSTPAVTGGSSTGGGSTPTSSTSSPSASATKSSGVKFGPVMRVYLGLALVSTFVLLNF